MENEVRKMDSARWTSSISPENSEWLAENVKGVDQSVKEMLLLIEDDGDFSAEKDDNNHPKQSELIAHIKEISHRHHLLADHYNKLTGELSSHIQLSNGMKKNEETAFGDQPMQPFLTPDKKLGIHNVQSKVAGSDLSLSSGGGTYDTTPNEGSESSLLSSDSDSESCNSSPNARSSSLTYSKMMKLETINKGSDTSEMEGVTALVEQEHAYDTIQVKREEYQMLLKQISDNERELKVSNDKNLFAEEEISKLKRELQHNEAAMVEMSNMEAQLLSAQNQVKLQEAELEKENERSLLLQRQIVDLEASLESEKRHVLELQENLVKYTTELSDRDHHIEKLSSELLDASGNFALEKWELESSISKLSERLMSYESITKELQMQCESLTEHIKKCEAGKAEMENRQQALKIHWQDEVEHMKVEVSNKNELLDTLSENLDGLKREYDILMSEKDELNSELERLNNDLNVCDVQIQQLNLNLHELHSENKRLSEGSDIANKLTGELKSRIDALEKEVEIQALFINETAEGKREAIRQLCFSLDHFRSAYQELRDACVTRKRPTPVVA